MRSHLGKVRGLAHQVRDLAQLVWRLLIPRSSVLSEGGTFRKSGNFELFRVFKFPVLALLSRIKIQLGCSGKLE
jgi:hypothetical protein